MKYYSEITKKVYDSEDLLKKAEAEVAKAEKAKKDKANARKVEADKVEEVFKKLNAVKRDYNKNVVAAYQEYRKKIAEEDQKLHEADRNFNEAVENFRKNHLEGFHITLKDGDNVVTISQREIVSDEETSLSVARALVSLLRF